MYFLFGIGCSLKKQLNILVDLYKASGMVVSRQTPFSDTSTQSVEDKLKRVILHDLKHGKRGKTEEK